MHQAGCGAHGGRRQTRQEGLLAFARDATAGRQKTLEGWVLLVRALAHPGRGVRDSVDARAGQSPLIKQGDGFLPLAARGVAIGRRAAHLGDQTPEQLGNRIARPGVRHRDPEAARVLQSRGAWREVMVLGRHGPNGSHLARAQAHTAIDPPEEAMAKGSAAQGHALQEASGLEADA